MKFLVVDDIAEVRELTALLLSAQFDGEVVEASNAEDAIALLQTTPFDLVVSNYRLPMSTGRDLFSALRKHSGNVPFLLVSPAPYMHLSEFEGDAYFEAIARPFNEELLVGKVQLLEPKIKSKVWQAGYIPVSIEILEKMGFVGVDLFVQLGVKNFVKVNHSKHLFSADDGAKKRSKGVKNLFIELKQFDQFIELYRKNVFAQVAWDSLDTAQSLKILSADWNMVMQVSRGFGCSEDTIALVQENIARVLTVLSQGADFKEVFLLFSQSKQNRLASHCYLIATLATAIVEEMGCCSSAILQKLTYAALLHDMTLDDELFLSKQTVINSLPLAEWSVLPDLKKIFDHPEQTAQIVSSWASCPWGVDEMIYQHHEKPDGTGFPRGLNFETILPLAAVLIVAEDIIYHCLDNFKTKPYDYLKSKAHQYQHGEFFKVFAAAEKVLASSKKH